MAELSKLVLVVDLDKTLCTKKLPDESYADVKPICDMIDAVNTLHKNGSEVIIESARNMLTQSNNEAKVIKNIGLTTLKWLNDNNVEYKDKYGVSDVYKPIGSCYIDDKALRPKEFLSIYNSLEDKSNLDELGRKIKEYLENN